MKPHLRWLLAAALILGQPSLGRSESAESVISGWSRQSRLTAAAMIGKYGRPDRVVANRLVWERKGPWKRIRVWNAPPGSAFGPDILEETVAYRVDDPRARARLAEFSGKVRVADSGTALSARGDDEEHNRLALNLADRIVKGDMSPAQASELYEKTLYLRLAGKESPMLKALMFSPQPAPGSRPPVRLGTDPDSMTTDPRWRVK